MEANTARRYRLYPTKVQAERVVSWQHTVRAVWNTALAHREWAYHSATRTRLTAVDQCKELTAARGEYDWLKDLPAQCAQQTLRQLDQAYKNWWNTDHRASAPTFKRKTARQGVLFPGQVIQVRRTGRRSAQVQLPKLGWVRFRLSRPLGGRVRNATISRDGLGWHVSFGVHVPESETPEHTGPAVGVDLGIACSAFLSNETTERQRPATLTAGERSRLVRLERRKARQIRFAKRHNRGSYSNRLRRTISQIAALKARQGRRRADFNHKLTTDLAQNHGLVAVENLAVSNMVRTARGTVEQPGKQLRQKAGLNRSISDQGWHEIRRQLGYKTRRHGSLLVVVPAQHTSQWCAACGTIDPDNREGCGRLFACLHCDTPTTPTAMPPSTSWPEQSAPPDRRDPPPADAVGRRARAVHTGNAP